MSVCSGSGDHAANRSIETWAISACGEYADVGHDLRLCQRRIQPKARVTARRSGDSASGPSLTGQRIQMKANATPPARAATDSAVATIARTDQYLSSRYARRAKTPNAEASRAPAPMNSP